MGVSGAVVDDTLQAGRKEFWDLATRTMEKFRSKDRILDGIVSAGVQIRDVQDGFFLSQSDYAEKLVNMKLDATFNEFRSVRAKLAWICNTQADVMYAVMKIAKVKEGTFGEKSVKMVNKVIPHTMKDTKVGIEVPQLDIKSTSIVIFTDAAQANNDDLSSQIGYIVALQDKHGSANILEYSSRKCRRVTHSSLAGEIMAFSTGFDTGFSIKHDLETMTRRRFPLYMLTDSKGHFDMVTRNSYSTELRLMIDMAAIRESYGRREMEEIAHIGGSNNPADEMTEIVNSESLRDLMRERMTVGATQWILRRDEG